MIPTAASETFWLWNGEIVPETAIRVSPRDRGLRYGDGLYETLRIHRGRIVRLEEHLARMTQGLELLRLDLAPAAAFPAPALTELLRLNGLEAGEGRLRLLVTRGPDSGLAVPPATARPTCLAQVEPLPPGAPPSDPRPIRLASVALAAPRPADWASLKSLNHLPYVLAAAEAVSAGADEALLVYESWVKETTAANVFLVREGIIVTPPKDQGLLAGVTRDLVIELARAARMRVEERAVATAEVRAATEMFATGSVAGIRAVESVDGRSLGPRVPGPVTLALRASYAEVLAAEVEG